MLIPFLDYPVLFFNPLRRPPAKGRKELANLLKAVLALHIGEVETDIDFSIRPRPRWRRFGAPKYDFGSASKDQFGGIFQSLYVTFAEFEGSLTDVPVTRRITLIAAMAEASGIDIISFHFNGADLSAHELIAAETLVSQLDRIR